MSREEEINKLQASADGLNAAIKQLHRLIDGDFVDLWKLIEYEIDLRIFSLNAAVESKIGIEVSHPYVNGRNSEDVWFKNLPRTLYAEKMNALEEINKQIQQKLGRQKELRALEEEK